MDGTTSQCGSLVELHANTREATASLEHFDPLVPGHPLALLRHDADTAMRLRRLISTSPSANSNCARSSSGLPTLLDRKKRGAGAMAA